ncbi:uncharacterized protein LOC143448562 isoform X1 [Clavelina lepadiformis]|uniref:uncharacterized protein LOC143448562 isoform X1 n=1 Tax=Clavelina lepadiformis TaxID=159417 RepID=UPI00404125DB
MIITLCAALFTIIASAEGIEHQGWSQWYACNSTETCITERFQQCSSRQRSLQPSLCVEQDEPFSESILGSVYCPNHCDVVGTASETSCAGDCYDATKSRVDLCSQSGCSLRRTIRCYNPRSCSGTWSRLGPPTQCSVSCGGGVKQVPQRCFAGRRRMRTHNCQGTDMNVTAVRYAIELCNTHECPDWSAWSKWSECSTTCDGGTRKRTRQCKYKGKPSDLCSFADSQGLITDELESCNTQSCQHDRPTQDEEDLVTTTTTSVNSSDTFIDVDSNILESWSEWTSCNSPCSEVEGIKTRQRCLRRNELRPSVCDLPEIVTDDCFSTELCTECSRSLPCLNWGEWENIENCSTADQIVFQRTCNSEWKIHLTSTSCPSHQYLRREECLYDKTGLSVNQIGAIVGSIVALLVIIAFILAYLFFKKKIQNIKVENQSNTFQQSTAVVRRQIESQDQLENLGPHYEDVREVYSYANSPANRNPISYDYTETEYQLGNVQESDSPQLNYLRIDEANQDSCLRVNFVAPTVVRAPYPTPRLPPQPVRGSVDVAPEPGYVAPST